MRLVGGSADRYTPLWARTCEHAWDICIVFWVAFLGVLLATDAVYFPYLAALLAILRQ